MIIGPFLKVQTVESGLGIRKVKVCKSTIIQLILLETKWLFLEGNRFLFIVWIQILGVIKKHWTIEIGMLHGPIIVQYS